MKKCIVCEKKIEEKEIKKDDLFFCSNECLMEYQKKLAELANDLDWDNCC